MVSRIHTRGRCTCWILSSPARTLETNSVLLRRASAGAVPEQLPDLLLIERSRAGDALALEALVRRHARRLYRLAYGVLCDDEAALGAVKETLAGALAELHRLEPSGKIVVWLTRLVHQHARARAQGALFAHAAAADELLGRIAALPEAFRTVFILRVIEGVSGTETSACLGLHETTVRTRLYRANRRLGPEAVQQARTSRTLLELPAAALPPLIDAVLPARRAAAP